MDTLLYGVSLGKLIRLFRICKHLALLCSADLDVEVGWYCRMR